MVFPPPQKKKESPPKKREMTLNKEVIKKVNWSLQTYPLRTPNTRLSMKNDPITISGIKNTLKTKEIIFKFWKIILYLPVKGTSKGVVSLQREEKILMRFPPGFYKIYPPST